MRIVLTHIPRTGGTSLLAALHAQLPQAKWADLTSVASIAVMNDKELDSYQLLSTYVGSALFDRLENDWLKVVVLRNPVERLTSSYWNLRNDIANESQAAVFAKSMSFGEYLASRHEAIIAQSTNIQTWAILGDKSMSFRQRFKNLEETKLVELALDRLGLYRFVGFTDQLEDLWRRLSAYCGFPVAGLPTLRKGNAPTGSPSISQSDVEFHTSMDAEFIKLARELQGGRRKCESSASIGPHETSVVR